MTELETPAGLATIAKWQHELDFPIDLNNTDELILIVDEASMIFLKLPYRRKKTLIKYDKLFLEMVPQSMSSITFCAILFSVNIMFA